MTQNSIFLSISVELYGLIILISVLVILRFFLKYQKNKITDKSQNATENFKKKAERIFIQYDDLQIKSNSWQQEIVVGSGATSRNELKAINSNTIILNKKHQGHQFNEEFQVEMEPERLRMKLAIENELSFYYNPNNFDENFLDIEFLYN